ncbi:MAG: hypothetical protein LUD02_02685 [Tannerellaceae bacterium]|nr:hypothetical protein [Tannerellaceae bacterium]
MVLIFNIYPENEYLFFHSDITLKGGIERVTSILSNFIVTKYPNISVEIVSQFKTNNKPIYCINEKIKIIYLSNKRFGKRPGSFYRLLLLLKNSFLISKHFKKNKYDFIISQAFPNTCMLYLTRVNLENVVAAEHVFYGYYNKYIQKLRLLIYRKVFSIVVLTNYDKKYIHPIFQQVKLK